MLIEAISLPGSSIVVESIALPADNTKQLTVADDNPGGRQFVGLIPRKI
jgi:hypothetical protein